ncbi:dolichyl-phosphate beta-glucosyltransferase [Streptomyces huiliensis]|uniref:dolichyl-phosphate beta-glucosyltransferase n=1 Tax=Streptomyces huiliensis TaxID=2876027 RepID=UPI001CC139F9|nr:dolichyl-phosphate beta-glucosyltransferase [Streptomyces huiliensis]MBZ4318010.1 glycosyltransferase family 2 protein [Streptomyces huiliensis]
MTSENPPSPPPDEQRAGAVGLSVVVPAYNEEDRLAPSLKTIRAHLDGEGTETWELIVVDDGSTDGTADVVRAAAAEDPRIRLLGSPANRGKGHAVRIGVLASHGRRVLVTDADLATPMSELPLLSAGLDAGAAAAVGSRALPGSRIGIRQHALREALGRAGAGVIRAVAAPGVRDSQCGFKLFEGERARTAFAASRLNGWAFDVEILRFFRKRGWAVAEVPVRWDHRPGSKVRPPAYAAVLGDLVRLRIRAVHPAGPAVAGLYLLIALFLYAGLWAAPNAAYLVDSASDQQQWEWFFAVTADNVAHLRDPFFTDLQNHPYGVNLMANTTMMGVSVPLAPLTLTLGPHVTWAVVLTGGTALTAWTWYRLLAKRLVRSRWAAALGGGFCAFAPPMVSHGTAHPNFAVLFVIPLIIERALRLCEGRRVRRDGVILGLLLVYQVFLGEEVLLLAATGLLLFAFGYAVFAPGAARAAAGPLLRGLAVAAPVAAVLLAVPLYRQFFGAQSYHSVLHGSVGNHPFALLEFATRSLAGDARVAASLSLNRTEENAFFGWPLIVLAVFLVVRMRDRPLVRALGFTALAAAVLSLGRDIPVLGTTHTLPGPWRVVGEMPLFESVIESRTAMICAPALGILLALACDRALNSRPRGERERGRRLAAWAAGAAALVPLLPTPYPTVERAPVPAFVADGHWRDHVRPGRTLVPVPVPDPGHVTALDWQARADFGFALPGGYFNGPDGPDRRGIYGPVPTPTAELLKKVNETGRAADVDDRTRRAFGRDLAAWRADAIVLPPQDKQDKGEPLRETVERLTGRKPQRVGGVWVWDVRDGV